MESRTIRWVASSTRCESRTSPRAWRSTDRSAARPISSSGWATELSEGTDWQDHVFQTGITQSYNLAVRGGNEKTTFFVSGRYNNDEGQIIASKLEQGLLRVNLDHFVTEDLQVESRINLGTNQLRGTISNGPFNNSPFWAAHGQAD